MKDLIVLAADKSLQLVMQSLLGRFADLRVREISFDAVIHVRRDPGVCLDAHNFLRPLLRGYGNAVAICDWHGCGQEARSRQEIESRIEENLFANGWGDRAAAIVIDPEIENWIWGDWRATSRILNWRGDQDLRQWLIEKSLLGPSDAKPHDPKGAFKSALRCVDKRWSSAFHQQIATEARFEGCIDAAFLKLRSVLHGWFGLAE
jgi:hypothetical protein